MTFTDPIVGGESKLVRTAIESPNYVPGVSGWIVRKDGTAEFNNTVIRGSLRVTDPDGSYVWIYDEDPGDGALVEFGLPSGIGVTQTPGRIITSTSIPFFGVPGIAVSSPTVNGSPVATVALGSDPTLDESFIAVGADNVRLQGTIDIDLLSADNVNIDFTQPDGSFNVLGSYAVSTFEGDVVIEGNHTGKWVAGAGSTASLPGVISAETVQLTAKDENNLTPTYRAGHAYRVVIRGQVTTTNVANQPLWRLKKTNTAGQQFDAWRSSCMVAGQTYPVTYETGFRVDPNNDVTADIVLSLTSPAGVTMQLTAAATSPAVMDIYDDGLASNTVRSWLPTLI